MPINKFTTLLDLARQAKIISGETATFDGKIEAGIPFSGYPTGVDTGSTVSLGVVSSEDAVFSGNTGTTVFDVSNTGSTNYDAIFSGYSATTWSNPLFSGNTSGLTLPITPLSASTQIVGPFWTLTQTGMTGDYVIGTQYTGYSITYSFFDVSQFGTGFTYSGFTTASQENFSAGTLDYKGPLDYISSVEDATVDGRLTTNKLTVTGGASSATTGYVLTQTGNTGEAGWVFNSSSGTTTYWDSGSGLYDTLGSHVMTSGSETDFSIIAGGENNVITKNGILSARYNGIFAGSGNTITATNFGVLNNVIIGGTGNDIGGTGASNEGNIIIGGEGNSMNVAFANNSVIIGMVDKTTTDYVAQSTGTKVYTPSLDVTNEISVRRDVDSNSEFPRISIENYDVGNDSRSVFRMCVSGNTLPACAYGTIVAFGPDASPTGTFSGSYLPNSLTITSGNNTASERLNINIGSRRGADAETRFFGGSDSLDNSSLLGTFYTSGLTITDKVNTDTFRIRSTSTPTGTADASGEVGDVSWDDDYIYIKTSIGWRRSALSSW